MDAVPVASEAGSLHSRILVDLRVRIAGSCGVSSGSLVAVAVIAVEITNQSGACWMNAFLGAHPAFTSSWTGHDCSPLDIDSDTGACKAHWPCVTALARPQPAFEMF